MSTDRELLELAAKAAGLTGGVYGELSGGEPVLYFQTVGIWTPLTDDGDALRLAVMLRLDVVHNEPQDHGAWVMVNNFGSVEDVDGEGSRLAATRRAIVRAAAEIGRAMP